jgi:hypothetical protein
MSYGGNGKTVSVPAAKASNGPPDFRKMTTSQKVAYHRERLRVGEH